MAASRSVPVTASRPDIELPVDVYGDVDLESPSGRQGRLSATGSRLQLALPGWTELRELGPRSLRARRRSLAAAIRALQRLGLALDVNVNGRRVFAFGTDVKATVLARLLGLRSADIRFWSVVSLLRT